MFARTSPSALTCPFYSKSVPGKNLRPSLVLTWKSSKATLTFSVRCAAAAGWSAKMGQQTQIKGKYRDVVSFPRPDDLTVAPRFGHREIKREMHERKSDRISPSHDS